MNQSTIEEKANIMKNKVIEVLTIEHGKKVIEYWKSIGVDTKRLVGDCSKRRGDRYRYYGVIDGCFDCYSERQASKNNAEIIELPEEKAKENRNIMKNKVIEVLTIEHGRRVIEYWKSIGVNTLGMSGSQNQTDGDLHRYYGVIDGRFDCYSEREAAKNNAEIIELPEEKTYPRVMMVSFDSKNWFRRVVFMEKCGRYLAWENAKTVEEAENQVEPVVWRFAKDIEPKPRTITLSDLNSKIDDIKKILGIEVSEDVIIKLIEQ